MQKIFLSLLLQTLYLVVVVVVASVYFYFT